MKKEANGEPGKPSVQRRTLSVTVIALNVLLLTFAVLSYGRYTTIYRERLREENLSNIANLNQSAATNATTLIDSWAVKLEDLIQYLTREETTAAEALTVIEESNSSPDRQFELIGGDGTGYLARRDENGEFIPLSYKRSAYADLYKAFDDVEDSAYEDVCFAPEFTDGHTARKYFAIYRHIPLINGEGERETYTLLLAAVSRDVLAAFNSQSRFTGQSTVLIGDTGNYIVNNQAFQSNNFFQYLYVYNDLSLEQRRQIEQEMDRRGSGELYYRNGRGEDCVFRYERMTTNDWYCVTCVPIASYHTPVMNANYATVTVLALLFLMVLDVAWLLHMNSRMRSSMLREKEASEAKTDFLSRMSHDIRTPLNGIIGLTALALDRQTDGETREYLENIRVSGQFLTGLVNDILDLSKVESGKVELHPEPYSSKDLCKYVDAVVTPLCKEKGLTFLVSPADQESPVMLDRLRFNQVLFNLLSNAVKYTPSGGLVELYWTRTDLPTGKVALEFTVRDNGIGMSEAFQAHMFESFTQEHDQTANTGSGLGLAIVSSLVKLMNGTVRVKSKPGEGSTFTVHLETDVCPRETEDAGEPELASLAGRRALLCEDNPINTLVARRMLEKWGMTVDTADNGRQGVEKFVSSAPNAYDVILMDVMMPEMNGLDATRAIRGLDRPDAAGIPIIAMTANAYDTDVQNCLDAGMDAHLGKPIDPERLRTQLSRSIARGNGV